MSGKKIKVALIMGSQNDYKILKKAEIVLSSLNITYSSHVISAHRTPKEMFKFAQEAHLKFDLIIAGAGGAAHLPGMVASMTTLPVIGVPIMATKLKGLDALLSIVQMPRGLPVATVAIDNAENAALLAARILAGQDEKLRSRLARLLQKERQRIKAQRLPKMPR